MRTLSSKMLLNLNPIDMAPPYKASGGEMIHPGAQGKVPFRPRT